MSLFLKNILFIFISLCFFTGVSQGVEDSCLFMEIGGLPCQINFQGSILKIYSDGAFLVNSKANINSELKFDLPEGYHLSSIKYQVERENLFFTLEIEDGEDGSAVIGKYDSDKNALVWCKDIYAFNASPLLVTEKWIYVGGIGMVAKLNLSDGKIIWQHKGLYEAKIRAFNSFKMPRSDGNIIVYEEKKPSSLKRIGTREIRVNDFSGEIISK